MTTIESNKLIAEFMGHTVVSDGISYMDEEYRALKKYNLSWDALIPVADRIKCNRGSYDAGLTVLLADVEQALRDLDLDTVYSAVVKFIKAHNGVEAPEKRTFRVHAEVVTRCYLDVEARDADEAHEIANKTDGGNFTPIDHEGSFEVDSVEEITKEKV